VVRVRRTGRGGPRPGAGRPRSADSGEIRRNRLTVLLTDSEIAQLEALAKERRLPVGTVAYEVLARSLARRKNE